MEVGYGAVIGARAAEGHLAAHLPAGRSQDVFVAAGAGCGVDGLAIGVVGGIGEPAAGAVNEIDVTGVANAVGAGVIPEVQRREAEIGSTEGSVLNAQGGAGNGILAAPRICDGPRAVDVVPQLPAHHAGILGVQIFG